MSGFLSNGMQPKFDGQQALKFVQRAFDRLRNRLRWPERDYLVNLDRKFIYCHIPKVACSSLKRWFLLASGMENSQIDSPHALAANYRLGGLSAQRWFSVLHDPTFLRFAFVRNPWARLVSAYLNQLLIRTPVSEPVLQFVHTRRGRDSTSGMPGECTDITFRSFLEFLSAGRPEKFDGHWKPQYLFFEANRFHLIGRFERLADDFTIVAQMLGIEHRLPHENATKYAANQRSVELVADLLPRELFALPAMPSYQAFYTPSLRDLAAHVYSKDIELFGYRFEEGVPPLVRRPLRGPAMVRI